MASGIGSKPLDEGAELVAEIGLGGLERVGWHPLADPSHPVDRALEELDPAGIGLEPLSVGLKCLSGLGRGQGVGEPQVGHEAPGAAQLPADGAGESVGSHAPSIAPRPARV